MVELLLYSIAFVVGLLFATWWGRKTRNFKWSEYVVLVIFPTLAILWLIKTDGVKVLFVYFFSVIAGTTIEYLVGWAYHRTEGKRLWYYERYSFKGYTSWLSMPLWGITGIFFFLLVKTFGL